MSLQFNRRQRTFMRGFAGATLGVGSLLFATAITRGADVAGAAAPVYKTIAPSPLWLSTKLEDKSRRRAIESNVQRIIGGESIVGFEGPFDNYFTLVLFPQWTQITEKSLNELPKERNGFLKDVETSSRNPAAHARLVDLTH